VSRRLAWEELGWSQDSWEGRKHAPLSELKAWEELSSAERAAAAYGLGYTPSSWDADLDGSLSVLHEEDATPSAPSTSKATSPTTAVSAEKADAIKATKELLGTKEKCDEVWKALDYNGNGVVSVAETGKFLLDSQDSWDGFFKPLINETTGKAKQPVMIRAWKKATSREFSTHEDSFVHKHEFRVYVRLLIQYNYLFDLFEEADGDDRRIDVDEFKKVAPKIGFEGDDEELEKIFKNMDKNDGGKVLFDEWCAFAFAIMDAPPYTKAE